MLKRNNYVNVETEVASLDSIKSHDSIADYYEFRPQYHDDFISKLVSDAKIKPETVVCDLLCGRGELAHKLSSVAKTIYAIDGSQYMLDKSLPLENVRYILADVVRDKITLPEKVDVISIGSAIHWIPEYVLSNFIENNLKSNGIVVVTHALNDYKKARYRLDLYQVNKEFGKDYDISARIDLYGVDKLKSVNYTIGKKYRAEFPAHYDFEHFLNNQISFSYQQFHHNIMDSYEDYRMKIKALFDKYSTDGQLEMKEVNWFLVYTPKEGHKTTHSQKNYTINASFDI